jgi:hypothetical protein
MLTAVMLLAADSRNTSTRDRTVRFKRYIIDRFQMIGIQASLKTSIKAIIDQGVWPRHIRAFRARA